MGQGRAPYDTLVFIKGEANGSEPQPVRRLRSSIPWHSDDEPLFGDQSDPKVIVSMSLGSSVDFRVCRRGRRNAPSSIRLDHGDLLVMDGLAQSEYEHSTSSELQGLRVNLTGGYHSTPRPAKCCGPGLVVLCHRVRSSGWWSLRASHWRAPRLPTGFACVVAVFVPAAPLWCDLFLYEDRRAGLERDGGEYRGGVDHPNGVLGNSLSGRIIPKGGAKSFFLKKAKVMCTSCQKGPHPWQQWHAHHFSGYRGGTGG